MMLINIIITDIQLISHPWSRIMPSQNRIAAENLFLHDRPSDETQTNVSSMYISRWAVIAAGLVYRCSEHCCSRKDQRTSAARPHYGCRRTHIQAAATTLNHNLGFRLPLRPFVWLCRLNLIADVRPGELHRHRMQDLESRSELDDARLRVGVHLPGHLHFLTKAH